MLSIFALNVLFRRITTCLLLLVLWASNATLSFADSIKERTIIFAAASLTDVLPELNAAWSHERSDYVAQVSFGASAILARQIEAGAPATVFLSANRVWVNYLAAQATDFGRSVPVAHNTLVVAGPCRGSPKVLKETQLLEFLSTNRFAMADPAVAPAGTYAKSFLRQENMWETVRPNAAYAGNARLALLLIERANLPGIVYATDAHASDAACVLLELPFNKDGGISYFAMGRVGHEASVSFINWLGSPSAKSIWERFGFKTVSN